MTLSVAAGGSATAAFVDSIAPLGVVKPTDESLTSNTTLQNDNDLFATLVASATYGFMCVLDYEGGTQGSADMKWLWSVPSGAAMRYSPSYLGTGGGFTFAMITGATQQQAGTNGAASLRAVTMFGTVVMSTTPGNVQLQWAQNTTSTTPLIVHAGSLLTLWRLS